MEFPGQQKTRPKERNQQRSISSSDSAYWNRLWEPAPSNLVLLFKNSPRLKNSLRQENKMKRSAASVTQHITSHSLATPGDGHPVLEAAGRSAGTTAWGCFRLLPIRIASAILYRPRLFCLDCSWYELGTKAAKPFEQPVEIVNLQPLRR